MPNSILRQYTPPTCTLQIIARSSPLSRWTRQTVTTMLQFELRFDDPRLPEEKQVKIQGDRNQLEALHEAVKIYTQNLLNQSAGQFNAILSLVTLPPLTDGVVSSSPEVLDVKHNSKVSEEQSSLNFFSTSARLNPATLPKNPSLGLFEKIFLQPGRGLSHKLFLGSLATEETGAVIQLSVLQLFDLATALDQYAADTLLVSTNRPKSPAATAWGSIAAILLVAVGLTTVVQLLNRSSSEQQIANRSTSNNAQQPTTIQTSPLVVVPTPLPPLPSVPPLSSVPSPSQTPATTPGTASDLNPGAAPLTVPVNPIPRAIPAPPFNTPIPNQDSLESILREAAAASNGGRLSKLPTAQPSATLPSSEQLTPPNRDLQTALSGAARSGGTPTAQQIPNTTTPFPSSPNPQAAANGNTSGEQTQGLTQTRSPSAAAPAQPKATAFDAIPQVAQVRDYFKPRWKPPSGLKQTLEYSVVLDIDGSIQQIIPLGQAAIKYVDISGMPRIGQRFISPNQSGQTPKIRVVLFPDGKVQTFLESSKG